tara:strand:+ start:74 stop:469 length:396 start_codon:yes stop_codon:yes gene_type:complete
MKSIDIEYVINSLKDGFNPFTKKELIKSSNWNSYEIMEDLHTYFNMDKKYEFNGIIYENQKDYKQALKNSEYFKTGTKWDEKDEILLVSLYRQKKDINEVGLILNRLPGSVWSRIEKLIGHNETISWDKPG